jgi:hypothetical protein
MASFDGESHKPNTSRPANIMSKRTKRSPRSHPHSYSVTKSNMIISEAARPG